MTEDDGTLKPGDKIDDYRIEKVLGAGSFGVTYLAREENLDRDVAIKEYMPVQYAKRDATGTISSRNAETAGTFEWGLDRFSEEARTLAQFDHPNIVRVLRIVQSINGTSYIVMELLGGANLESIVEDDGPLDTQRFLSIFLQLLQGVEAVHQIGILHRDIKPANIVLEERGPVLIDFGAARDLALQQKAGFSALVTDGFSPPEQYSSKNSQSEASDIYALAATAHFFLTGEIPPPAAARHAGEDMKAGRELAEDLPEDVADGIDWGLELKIVDRPQSISEWLAKMPSLTAEPSVEPEVVVIEKNGFTIDRRALLFIGGGVVVAGGAGALLIGRDTSINSSSNPLEKVWQKTVGQLSSEPYPGIAANDAAVFVAAHSLDENGNDRLSVNKFDDDGNPIGEYVHNEPGSRGHAVLPALDGSIFVGGEAQAGSLVLKLDKQLKLVWQKNYQPGSISSLMFLNERLVAGLEGPESSGQAKLLFLGDDGRLTSDITLLDRRGDSVQQIAALADGSIAVLGMRLQVRTVDGAEQNVASLWLAKVAVTGEELWRVAESGLGYANCIDVIEAGNDIYVSGKTSPDGNAENYKTMVMRVSSDGQKQWTRWDYGDGPSSGRGLAQSGDGSPSLYMAGWSGSPPRSRLSQIGPDGDFVWDDLAEEAEGFGNVSANVAIRPGGGTFLVGIDVPTSERLDLTISKYE